MKIKIIQVVGNNNSSNKATTQAAEEEESDSEEETADEEDENESSQESQNNSSNNTSNNTSNDDSDTSEDEEEEEETPTTTSEGFFGGSVEHFSNQDVQEKATSMNTLLKAVMITCLFYVLAHKESKKYLMGNIFKSIRSENYLYIAMVLFFIIFYVISVFL